MHGSGKNDFSGQSWIYWLVTKEKQLFGVKLLSRWAFGKMFKLLSGTSCCQDEDEDEDKILDSLVSGQGDFKKGNDLV